MDLNGNYQFPTPEIPSGDSGDVGLGNITNSSGDNMGNINLQPIKNSLNNIENKIPSSGDIQGILSGETGKVVNAINNANENYWGGSGDLTGDTQESEITGYLNDIISDVSGEFSNNAVFQQLDSAENIFLDFFRNQEDESFYDLIISWDTISPVITMYGGSEIISSSSIISGDSINFSSLCRNNSTLFTIQQTIRIIFNFGCAIALIWQIYNLILSTLGIDNPYLYEDSSVNDIVNVDTGEVHSYVKTRRRVFKRWW